MNPALAEPQSERLAKRPLTDEDLFGLIFAKASHAEIAAEAGCSRQNISQRFKRLQQRLYAGDEAAYQAAYKRLLRSASITWLTEALKPEKLEKAGVLQLATSAGIANTHLRLELGQSTSNVALHSLIDTIERDRGGESADRQVGDGA